MNYLDLLSFARKQKEPSQHLIAFLTSWLRETRQWDLTVNRLRPCIIRTACPSHLCSSTTTTLSNRVPTTVATSRVLYISSSVLHLHWSGCYVGYAFYFHLFIKLLNLRINQTSAHLAVVSFESAPAPSSYQHWMCDGLACHTDPTFSDGDKSNFPALKLSNWLSPIGLSFTMAQWDDRNDSCRRRRSPAPASSWSPWRNQLPTSPLAAKNNNNIKNKPASEQSLYL
jgi:hypothetical protein